MPGATALGEERSWHYRCCPLGMDRPTPGCQEMGTGLEAQGVALSWLTFSRQPPKTIQTLCKAFNCNRERLCSCCLVRLDWSLLTSGQPRKHCCTSQRVWQVTSSSSFHLTGCESACTALNLHRDNLALPRGARKFKTSANRCWNPAFSSFETIQAWE